MFWTRNSNKKDRAWIFKKVFSGSQKSSHIIRQSKRRILFLQIPYMYCPGPQLQLVAGLVSFTVINILPVFSSAINHFEFKWEELQN